MKFAAAVRLIRTTSVWFVLLGFACVPAHADDTTARLRVSLRAAPSVVASIEVRPAGGGVRRWSTIVTGSTSASIDQVPAGPYTLTASLPESAPATLTLAVPPHAVLSVTIQRRDPDGALLLALEDVTDVSGGIAFSRRQLRDLPSGADFWPFIETAAPFVVADRMDTGGIRAGSANRISARGSSWTDTTIAFGSTRATTLLPNGDLTMLPALDAAEGLAISSGLAPPEISSPGAAIFLAPRRPDAEWRGTVDASFTSSSMVATNATAGAPSIARLNSWSDVGASAGGPLGARAGVFVAVSGARSEFDQRDRGLPVHDDATAAFSHLIVNPTEADELRVVTAGQHITRPYPSAVAFTHDTSDTDTLWQSQATWDHATRGGVRTIEAGIEDGRFVPSLGMADAGTIDRALDGLVPAPPAEVHRRHMSGSIAMTARSRQVAGMSHSARLVFGLDQTSETSRSLATPDIAESVAGLPAHLWATALADVDSRRTVNDVTVALSDRVSLTDRLTIDAGVRLRRSTGNARGAASSVTWRNAAPRVGLRWYQPWLTLSGGYGRYFRDLTPDVLSFGDPGEPITSVYLSDDNERGDLVFKTGRNIDIASIDPSLRAPRTDEVSLSVERGLGARMWFRLTAAVRQQHDLLRSIDVGAPASSYTARDVPNQDVDLHPTGTGLVTVYDRLPSTFAQDAYLLTNVADEATSYRGLEATWRLDTERWSSVAGAMAYRADGPGSNRGFRVEENDPGLIGERLQTPNAETLSYGRLFFDRAYVLKWSTTYRAHHGVFGSFTARYQDGQPFSRLIVVPDLTQGPELVTVDESGSTRFTFTVTIDARLEKRFAFGRREASIRLDAFNLTNRANEVEENAVAGERFRDTTAVQPPRVLRVGLRFDF